MLRIQRDGILTMSVEGKPVPPLVRGWSVALDGRPALGIGCAGIHLNVKLGDTVRQFAGDHVEPGVTVRADNDPKSGPSMALYTLSCVGNQAEIVSGEAKGTKGIVTGHHGGGNHTLIDFPQKALERMGYGDTVRIQARGQGLKLLDYPGVAVYSLAPDLLQQLGIQEKNGALEIPVVATIPGKLMGSGIGSGDSFRGDYDIQTSDPVANKKLQLEQLRLGDFVALLDQDATYGYTYREGAITIGIIIHGDSVSAGHGPGVQILLTTKEPGLIRPVLKKDANLGKILKIGHWRKKAGKR